MAPQQSERRATLRAFRPRVCARSVVSQLARASEPARSVRPLRAARGAAPSALFPAEVAASSPLEAKAAARCASPTAGEVAARGRPTLARRPQRLSTAMPPQTVAVFVTAAVDVGAPTGEQSPRW